MGRAAGPATCLATGAPPPSATTAPSSRASTAALAWVVKPSFHLRPPALPPETRPPHGAPPPPEPSRNLSHLLRPPALRRERAQCGRARRRSGAGAGDRTRNLRVSKLVRRRRGTDAELWPAGGQSPPPRMTTNVAPPTPPPPPPTSPSHGTTSLRWEGSLNINSEWICCEYAPQDDSFRDDFSRRSEEVGDGAGLQEPHKPGPSLFSAHPSSSDSPLQRFHCVGGGVDPRLRLLRRVTGRRASPSPGPDPSRTLLGPFPQDGPPRLAHLARLRRLLLRLLLWLPLRGQDRLLESRGDARRAAAAAARGAWRRDSSLDAGRGRGGGVKGVSFTRPVVTGGVAPRRPPGRHRRPAAPARPPSLGPHRPALAHHAGGHARGRQNPRGARRSRDAAERQPRCSRDAAEMQPRRSRDAAGV